jgi:4-hydroxybenzoate polyprenyltransferase
MMGGRGVRLLIRDLFFFFRIPLLGYSLAPPLLGAASANGHARLVSTAQLLLIGALFHVPAVLLNDIQDLEVDRCDPMRTVSPLVRGTVSVRTAWCVAGGATVLMFVAARLVTPKPDGFIALLVGACAIAIYNFWGKRLAMPIATDLIQGIGWSAPAYFAAVVIGSPTRATYYVCTSLVLYTMIVTLYGAIRDLAADAAGGGFTTAMLLKEPGKSFPAASRRLAAYVSVLHLALLVVCLLPLVTSSARNPFAPPLSAVCIGISAIVARIGLSDVRNDSSMRVLGAASMTAAFAAIAILAASFGAIFLPTLAFLLFLVPLMVSPAFQALIMLQALRPGPSGGDDGDTIFGIGSQNPPDSLP